MKDKIALITSLIFLFAFCALNVRAASITNGDFSSNYTGWTQQTDDPYYPDSTFFTILGTTTNPYAQVSIDLDLDNDGVTDTYASFCKLYQAPDFTAPSGSTLTLSFDWLFDGDPTLNPTFDNDIFKVYFDDGTTTYDANGNPGSFLLLTTNYSSTWNHFSADISYYLNTSTPYNLTFELDSSLANNGSNNYWASHFCLDNVKITATTLLHLLLFLNLAQCSY